MVNRACVQRHGNPFTLLKRIAALAILNLRIIALVYACQMLHFYLSIAQFFSNLSIVTIRSPLFNYYGGLTY